MSKLNPVSSAEKFSQFSRQNIGKIYEFISEEITDYDCGELCRTAGESYCCREEHSIPLLYRIELDYLQEQNSSWRAWQPTTLRDRRYLESVPTDQLFCTCNSSRSCPRTLRSIACRTFPLEPYLDEEERLIALTFITEFTERDPKTGQIKCPLVKRKSDIRQAYIDQLYEFWELFLKLRPQERDIYTRTSERLRRRFESSGYPFHLLYPSQKESR